MNRRHGAHGSKDMRTLCLAVALGAIPITMAFGQAPPTAAKVDTLPLQLVSPERYHVPTVLEPIRRVTLVAAADGVVRSQDAREGAEVRANQEVAQLDKSEALANLKIAQAEAREWKATADLLRAEMKAGQSSRRELIQAEGRAEVAQARVELAQVALDRCTLRAPFAGRIVESFVSDGQFVTKGTIIAELADVSSLRAMVPLPRIGTVVGGAVTVLVEGQPVQGKVQTMLPLSESLSVLRELLTPLATAWVVVPNGGGALEPGQRVLSPALPTNPIAVVPARSVRNAEGKSDQSQVQVIRNEYVANVPVRVLGQPGTDRVQVTGPLRSTDALITSTSVPLLPGTLIRFNPGDGAPRAPVEGTTPNPATAGEPADVTPPAPAGGTPKSRAGRPTAPTTAPPSSNPPAQQPATKTQSTVPF